jgi:hypothetical protein
VYITRVPWGGLLQVWEEVDGPKYEFEDDPAIIFHPDHKVWRVVNHPTLQLEDGDAPGMLSYTEQEDEDAGAPGIVNAPEQDDVDCDAPGCVQYTTKKILVYKVDIEKRLAKTY